MPQSTVTNVKLMPMTMGSPEPMRPSGNSWMSVPMPAMSMALWMSEPVWSAPRPAAPATITMGARLATNMAKMCCTP